MKSKENLVSLDVLRGIACLLVWISHVRVATRYFVDSRFDFIQVFSAWGKESVMIFFILSGIVINLSSQNKTDQWQYFKKRFIRIYPIYLAILLICFACDNLILGHAIVPGIFIGNLLLSATLDGYLVPTMPLNPAVWSISCEAFFYLLFGLIYKSKRLSAIWVWFAVCCLSIIYRLLTVNDMGIVHHFIFLMNNSFLWILGYLVFEYRNKFQTSLSVAVCGLLMIPLVTRLHQLPYNVHEVMYFAGGIFLLPLFTYLLRDDTITDGKKIVISYKWVIPIYMMSLLLLWQYSNSLASSKIIYSLLPWLSLILYYKPVQFNIKWIYNRSKPFFRFFAGISYPLYLLHMPIMYLMFYFIPDQKLIGAILCIFLTISISYLFEIYLFKKPAALLNAYSILKLSAAKQDQS